MEEAKRISEMAEATRLRNDLWFTLVDESEPNTINRNKKARLETLIKLVNDGYMAPENTAWLTAPRIGIDGTTVHIENYAVANWAGTIVEYQHVDGLMSIQLPDTGLRRIDMVVASIEGEYFYVVGDVAVTPVTPAVPNDMLLVGYAHWNSEGSYPDPRASDIEITGPSEATTATPNRRIPALVNGESVYIYVSERDTGPVTLVSTAIIGPNSLNEGGNTGIYNLRETYSDSSTINITGAAAWSVTEGTLGTTSVHAELTIAANDVTGDGRTTTLTAVHNGVTYTKQVTIVDTTVVAPTYDTTLNPGESGQNGYVYFQGGVPDTKVRYNYHDVGVQTLPNDMNFSIGGTPSGTIVYAQGMAGRPVEIESATGTKYQTTFQPNVNL